jgi:hypothetical protein
VAKEFWVGKPSTARVTGVAFYYVESPAELEIQRMENAVTLEDKVKFSWLALQKDPGCIEAHLFRGTHHKDPALRLAHLRAAVESGIDMWDPVADEEGGRMSWWGFSATRPYMRAIQALGMEALECDNEIGARECFELLIEMNPQDNQRICATMETMHPTATSPRM